MTSMDIVIAVGDIPCHYSTLQ